MTKFYSLVLAALVLAPVAYAVMNQAAQMVWTTANTSFESIEMTKFYALVAACAVFCPVAFSVMSQAAQIVA